MIDFIDVTWYAVFNVADIFVVCGCIVFAWHDSGCSGTRRSRRLDTVCPEDEPAA